MSLDQLTERLDQFLESNYRNIWLKQSEPDTMEIYVRKGQRRISGFPIPTLDIANFGPYLDCDMVMRFLNHAERIKKKYDAIYFENVDAVQLIGRLILRGYKDDTLNSARGVYACLYKILPDPNLPS